MRQITSREIALCVVTMSTNFLRWHKAYVENSCNIKAELMAHNLTMHQLQLLFFLHMNPEIRTVSALSAELFISKGSLSLMLSKLEKNGYLRKEAPQKEDDGRKVYLSLTERAREVLKAAESSLLTSTSAIFEQMDDEAKNKFYAKLIELKQIFATGGIKL